MISPMTAAPPTSQNVVAGAVTSSTSTIAMIPNLTTTTEPLGVIVPPSAIRSIIDKTAQFVAKNGPEFEQRVLLDKGSEQKFSFLLPGNPYRLYYDAKVKEFTTGEVNEAVQPQIPQAIVEMKRREAEKKEKKEQLLALTAYATEPCLPGSGFMQTGNDGLLKLTDFAFSTTTRTLATMGDNRIIAAIEDGRPPDPPSEDQFTAMRPFAAALDIDVIKLTAQYVARNGQKFLLGLGQRERGNAQFAFLRATHPLFSYFTTLVDAYTRCLMPDKACLTRLKEDVGVAGRFSSSIDVDRKATDVLTGPTVLPAKQMGAMLSILERVGARQRWEEYDEKKKQDKAKEEAEERQQMHALDWHEFMVVEMINFTEEDDTLPLGPPLDLSQLTQPPVIPPLDPSSYVSEYQAQTSTDSGNLPNIPTNNISGESQQHEPTQQQVGISMASTMSFPISTTLSTSNTMATTTIPPISTVSSSISTISGTVPTTFTTTTTATAGGVTAAPIEPNSTNAPAAITPTGSTIPPNLTTPIPTTTTYIPQTHQGGFSDGPPEHAASTAVPIVVVPNYVRQPKKRGRHVDEMMKCPITGQMVPTDQMSDHLRILLLDPKWKEQKDTLLARAQKESAFASEGDFEANLANFVVKRPDLFGSVEDECESTYVPAPKRK